jgi:glycosyltransferase involved in cell wall biosynthesis
VSTKKTTKENAAMRVVVIFEYPTLSGGERSLLAALPYLREQGISPQMIAPAGGPLARTLAELGFEIVPWEIITPATAPRSRQSLRGGLAQYLSTNRPDLLHANSLSMGRLTGPVARELALPSITHLRDIVGLSKGAVAELNCHNRLLAVSRATKAHHVAQGVDAERIHVLYNGVDLSRFRPLAPTGWLHRELGLSPSARLVGFVGQIALRKGLDVLVDAARLVCATFANVHFVVVGRRFSQKRESREYDAKLVRAARGDLAGRLHLLGERSGIERTLPELTLLVHPSRQEPLGRVLLEAAACGLPIIAARVGGTEEIFAPEAKAAELIPPGDGLALAKAIERLLADAPERLRLGSAARRRAEAAFDIRTAAEGQLRHYREVVGRKTTGL